MIKSLTSFFKRGSGDQKRKSFSTAMDELFLSNTFEYPIPAVDPEYLLKRNQMLISELYRNTGLSEEEFDEIVVPVLFNFAKYAQVLPASEKHHHSGVGGLFRHSLEVFVIAVRLSNGKSFCGGLEGKSKAITKVRWPLAVGFAGFLHDAGKAVHDMKAICTKSGDEWNPFNESLYDFAHDRKYLPVWRESRTHKTHEIVGGALADQIIPTKVRGWLNMGDPLVLPTMLFAISGFEKPDMPAVYEIVKQADKESVSKHLSLPARQDDGEESKRLPKYNSEAQEVIYSQQNDVINSFQKPTVKVESTLSKVSQNESTRKTTGLISTGISSPASDEFLKVLPESLANKDLVVNQRDRERGIFWVSGGVAWVSWPQLFNAMKVVFEKYNFSSYPRSPGQFFDMFEMASLVSKTDGEMSVSVRVLPSSGRSFKLNMALITSKDVINLIERYAENDVKLESESLGLNLEEESVMAIEPVKDGSSSKDDKAVTTLAKSMTIKQNPDEIDSHSAKSSPRTNTNSEIALDTCNSPEVVSLDQSEVEKITENISSSISPKEYISKLDNKPLAALRSTEDGEVLEEISASILTGRIPDSDWGLIDSCLYIFWPKSASVLGEDAEDILVSLGLGRRLAKSSDSKNISIKSNGISTITIKGVPKKVLALSKAATTIAIKAFELNNEFSIKGTPNPASSSSSKISDEIIKTNSGDSQNSQRNKVEKTLNTRKEINTASDNAITTVDCVKGTNKNPDKKSRARKSKDQKVDSYSDDNNKIDYEHKTVNDTVIKNDLESDSDSIINISDNESSGHSEICVPNKLDERKITNDDVKLGEVINAIDRYLAKNHKTYMNRIKIEKAFIVIEGFAEIYLNVSKLHSQVEAQLLHKIISSKHVHSKKQGKVIFFHRKLPTLKSVLNNK